MTEQNRRSDHHHHFNIPHRGHSQREIEVILSDALLEAFAEPETTETAKEEQPVADIIKLGDRLSIVRDIVTSDVRAA